MLKFIPGILLLQVITIAFVFIAPADLAGWSWMRLAAPVLIAGFLTAFWFGSIAAHQRRHAISQLKETHARERETIRVNAERAKTRLVKQAHHKTLQEVRRSSRRANIKIALAFAGAAGLGGLLLLTQFMTSGLLILTTAGGALSGYLLRVRQEKRKLHSPKTDPETPHIINATPDKKKQPARIEPP